MATYGIINKSSIKKAIQHNVISHYSGIPDDLFDASVRHAREITRFISNNNGVNSIEIAYHTGINQRIVYEVVRFLEIGGIIYSPDAPRTKLRRFFAKR